MIGRGLTTKDREHVNMAHRIKYASSLRFPCRYDRDLSFFVVCSPPQHVPMPRQTNEYNLFCTRDDIVPPKRKERHRQKKSFLGPARWPRHGITPAMMMGVLGIVITLGLVKLPQMSDHWDVHRYHDFRLVRDCMTRDMFALSYCRFFHMASAGAPVRRRDGTREDGWDALHHIR